MKSKPFFWALRQARKRYPAIAVMTAAQVGNALLSVCFALGSRAVIDSAQSGSKELFIGACIRQALIIAGILVCYGMQRHLRERLSADLEKDWKRRLLHGLLHGNYAQVSSYHSGELMNRLSNDVQKINEGILTVLPNAVAMLARLISAVVVLGALDASFTVIIVALGSCVILLTSLMRRWLKDLNKQVSHHDGRVMSFLQEVMEKLLVVQSMGVSQEVERRADSFLEDRYVIQRKRKNVSLFANIGVHFMSYGAGYLALVWCAVRMLAGQITFGSLTAVIQLVNQLQSPFISISGIIPQYVAMIASAERLMELDKIETIPSSTQKDISKEYSNLECICADGLYFSYNRDVILDNASFTIPKGAFCVITGPSGIGKSTLLKLMLNVLQPKRGKLYFLSSSGETPISYDTRGLFSYVPQGNLLFSGTVRDNLLIVKPKATQEELEKAIYVSAMDEFLPQLPAGLDTVLGESGAGLSEGQAQRLAIARAILGGAPILLLDESTSALDAETEQVVLQRIRALPDHTCIAVTHRPAAAQLCNWSLEIQDGKIHTVKQRR